MTPVDVTGRINPRTMARIGAQRRVSADVYAMGGETGAKTTWTLTYVQTVGATPTAGTATLDYAFT